MDWKNVASSFASVGLHTLGSSLAGPAGGAVAGLVCDWLGLDKQAADAPERLAAMTANPEALAKLRQIELDHEADLRRMQLEAETASLKVDLENVQGARSREVRLAGMGDSGAKATSVVALVVSVGFFVVLTLLFWRGSAALGEGGMLLLGTLATAFGAVVNYYLGSSIGSAQKTGLLRQTASDLQGLPWLQGGK